MLKRLLLATSVLLVGTAGVASAQSARAVLKDTSGKTVGDINMTQVTDGVLVKLDAKGLPPGEHAFHVHAVGKCEPPFNSAGGHFNPGNKKHGMMAADGHHAGDMPNLIVPSSGDLTVEVVNTAITLEKNKPNSLYQPNGTAFVVHASPDDYKTDPTGNAGGRIACGVVE